MSVKDVENAVVDVMKQNRDTLMKNGTAGMYQVTGTFNGKAYVLGVNNGRVGQFYPL